VADYYTAFPERSVPVFIHHRSVDYEGETPVSRAATAWKSGSAPNRRGHWSDKLESSRSSRHKYRRHAGAPACSASRYHPGPSGAMQSLRASQATIADIAIHRKASTPVAPV